jgi:hypothetical protein
MLIKVDTTDESLFKAKKKIAPGEYVFVVAKVESKTSGKGNAMVCLELRCQDEGEFKGDAVYDNIPVTKKTEWRVVHLLLSAGFTKDEISQGVDISDIKDRYVRANITIEPAKGGYKERSIVESYIFPEA